MSEAASSGGLQQLHRIHTEIQRVRGEIERGPRQVRARRKLAENKQAEIDQLKAKLLTTRKGADEKQLQLKSSEAKLRDLNIKLNQASNQREFDALKGQIDADNMANSVLEDEILEALERIDATQANIKSVEHEKAEAEKEANRFADAVTQNEAGLKAELEQLERSLAASEKVIPAKLMIDYRRLVAAHGPTALAPVEGKTCTSCMTNITAQQSIDLKAGRFTFCRFCGRLLYQTDD